VQLVSEPKFETHVSRTQVKESYRFKELLRAIRAVDVEKVCVCVCVCVSVCVCGRACVHGLDRKKLSA